MRERATALEATVLDMSLGFRRVERGRGYDDYAALFPLLSSALLRALAESAAYLLLT